MKRRLTRRSVLLGGVGATAAVYHSTIATSGVGGVTLTVNNVASGGTATARSGDDVWFVVGGATGGNPVVDLLSSGNAIRTVGPYSSGSFQGKLALGSVVGGAWVSPGSYLVRVRYQGSPVNQASVNLTVTNAPSVYATGPTTAPYPTLLGATGSSMAQAILSVGAASGNFLYGSTTACVVKGTATIGIAEFWTSGTMIPRVNNITIQYYLFGPNQSLTGTPLGGPIFDAGGNPTVTLDTRTLNDGTYMVSCQCIDSADTTRGWLAYQIRGFPINMIVQNFEAQSPIGTALIPTASLNGNGHCESTAIDFVQYLGVNPVGGTPLVAPNVAVPYPDIGFIPPVYSSASPFNPAHGGNPFTAVTAQMWGEGVSGMRFFEYKTGRAWGTTTVGGVMTQPWSAESTNASLTVEGSYQAMAQQSFLQGTRGNSQITGNSNIVATPDVGPFSAWHFTIIGLDGGLSVINFPGQLKVIAGPVADPSKLQMDKVGQPMNPMFPNTIQVGTISTDPLNRFTDFGGGANDVVWDPRSPGEIAYVCRPINHSIICIDFRVQTIDGVTYGPSNPYCYRYAGYDKGVTGNGAGGYAEGSALGTVVGGVQQSNGAQFNGPYSIQMQKLTTLAGIGHPQGTMYVADNYNGLIRMILPVPIPAAGTLVTAGTVSTLVGLARGAWTPLGSGTGSPSTAFNNFVNNYLTGPNNGSPGFPNFVGFPSPGVVAVAVSSYSQNADGTLAVVLSAAPTPLVPTVGWRVTVIVDGTYWMPAGTDQEAFGKYPITQMGADSQHFSIDVSYPGTGHSIIIWIYHADFYSSPAPVPFARAYTVAPQVLRMSSSGDVIMWEAWYNMMGRRIWLTGANANHITRIGPTGNIYEVNGPSWGWADCDDAWTWANGPVGASTGIGACGSLDNQVIFKMDSTPGSAATAWWWSIDGAFNGNFPGQESNDFPCEGQYGVGHYPWAFAYSKTQFRMLSLGRGMTGVNGWRPYRNGVDPDGLIDTVVWSQYTTEAVPEWANGTCDGIFPMGLRPSFKALYGQSGQHWLGANAVPSIDNLPILYPRQFNTSGSQSGTLAGWIQSGAGGQFARPELSMVTNVTPNVPGRGLARCLYFVTRQSLAGSFPTETPPLFFTGAQADNHGSGILLTPGSWPTDCIPPNITVLSIARQTSTTINATWTTDKPTIGLVAAGTVNSFGKQWPYNMWSPLETSFTTGTAQSPHSATVAVPSEMSPVHISIVAKDMADNWNCILDVVVT